MFKEVLKYFGRLWSIVQSDNLECKIRLCDDENEWLNDFEKHLLIKNKQNVYIVDFSLREENLQIIDCKLAPIKEKYGINSEVDH